MVPSTPAPILNDALSYIDCVKATFVSDPVVYDAFISALKSFRRNGFNVKGVVLRYFPWQLGLCVLSVMQ